MERISESKKAPVERSIEISANYKENASLLLFGRLQSPAVRKQILNLLYEGEVASEGEIHTDFNDETSQIVEKKYNPRTREEVESDFEIRLQEAERFTPIEFSDDEPSVSKMTVGEWKLFGEKLTPEQKNITAAHEAGHRIRDFGRLSSFFDPYFQSGFAITTDIYTPEYLEKLRIQIPLPEDWEKDRFDINNNYLFSANEIIERMSQLKNYFGMRENEQFTPAHLAYARNHYIQDTGMDNQMTPFFRAITPETEARFIELINTSGV